MFESVLFQKHLGRIGQDSCMPWRPAVVAFQTSAFDADNDYKLKNLVVIFGLSSDLLDT